MPTYKKQIRKLNRTKFKLVSVALQYYHLTLSRRYFCKGHLCPRYSQMTYRENPRGLAILSQKQPHIEYHVHHEGQQMNKMYKEYAQHELKKCKQNKPYILLECHNKKRR